MNEIQFGSKVRQALNRGLTVQPATAERLRAAREQALARQRREGAPELAWSGNAPGPAGWRGLAVRVVVPVLMLFLVVAGIYVWQQNERIAQIEEIDAQLLSDDLPPDAYLDRGFQNWLKKQRSSAEE